jgi:crotonobetainyl-CoA:carnitine CoA-transferase CaiB-like acyl-CoA transferase
MGPLSGVTVIELATSVAGPYGTLVLSALGARVIKVERPGGGDEARGWQPPSIGETGVMFAVMNAGKGSVVADLDDPDDRAAVIALSGRADVLVTSLRETSLARLGLDAESLRGRYPQLIYCRISAFGTDGPLAAQPGYDPLIQAFVGLMAVTGEEGRPPVRIGTSIVDMGTGLWTAIGVLAALGQRRLTGQGATIDASLLETGLAWLPYQIASYQAEGREPRRFGSSLPMLVPYQAFETADGYLVIAAGNDRLWQRLCRAIGRTDLEGDAGLARNAQRVRQRARVVEELSRTFKTRAATDWESDLRAVQVPCSVVHSVGQALQHEQVAATGILGSIGGVEVPGLPFRMDGWRPRPAGPPPPLGSDQADLGLAPAEARAAEPTPQRAVRD